MCSFLPITIRYLNAFIVIFTAGNLNKIFTLSSPTVKPTQIDLKFEAPDRHMGLVELTVWIHVVLDPLYEDFILIRNCDKGIKLSKSNITFCNEHRSTWVNIGGHIFWIVRIFTKWATHTRIWIDLILTTWCGQPYIISRTYGSWYQLLWYSL